MDIKLALQQTEEIMKMKKKIDKTPSIELLDEKLAKKVREILNKLSSNNFISCEERECLLTARDQIQKKLQNDVLMCKVIPINKLNEYISFKHDIGNFMLRKADLDELINQKYHGNIIDTLYCCLRLDHLKEPIKRFAIIELRISNFATRVPLAKNNYEQFTEKKMNIEEKEPYTGVGWTKSEYGIPEFFVTISDIENDPKLTVLPKYTMFPIYAFDTTVYVADRDYNTLINIAHYSNDMCEDDGRSLFEKFEVCSDKKQAKIRQQIILEEKILL